MRGDRADGSGALSSAGGPVIGGFFGQSSFSTYAIATQRNTIPIGDRIDVTVAAPLGCSVQTGVGAVLNALRPVAGDSIAIFGAGAVGLSAVMGARIAGCRTIIAVDPIAERRSLAVDLGATDAIDPTDSAVVEAVVELSGGGVAHAIDTTAIPAVLADAVKSLRARGQLGIVGLGAPMAELPVGLVMGKGLAIRGIVEGDSVPQTFIPELVDLYVRGDLPLEKIITPYDFADFDSAWQAARSGSVVKPVLTV
jgi:aryl-alcohol dehydrogenase